MESRENNKNFYFAYRSFWPEAMAHQRFNAIGINTVCFFAANTLNSLGEPYCKYPPNWVSDGYSPEGQYDFEPVDAQMADLMRNSPHARFICMIDLNTPAWLSAHIFKCDSFNQLGRICSNPEWRRVTAKYMCSLLEHLEKNYHQNIVAYVLAGGSTSEWYDLSNLAESPSRCAAWYRKLQDEGAYVHDPPGYLARNRVSFDGLLRDPESDGETLKYIRFCSEEIVNTIKFFLKEARAMLRTEVELGVFFGYPLVLQGYCGNYDTEELLKSPELDFVISPSGGFSKIGDGGGDLGPTESVQLHGKRYLRECDQKTHSYNKRLSKYIYGKWTQWENEAETIAGLKRELAYTLIKQCSCWWFDMWGGFYDSPEVMKLLSKANLIYREYINVPVKKIAEVALVVDADSIHYLNQYDKRISWFYRHTKLVLDRLGAPYECYNFKDIPDIPDGERIKLWILPGIFELTPENRKILDLYVRRPGKTAFYMYAPGISDGKTLDTLRVRELTGIDFGTPGVNMADIDGHLSFYAASGPDITSGILKNIAHRAEVHLYSEQEQPVYANSKFLAIHTATGGMQKIRLPAQSVEVEELFTREIVSSKCTEFEYYFKRPDTALFRWK